MQSVHYKDQAKKGGVSINRAFEWGPELNHEIPFQRSYFCFKHIAQVRGFQKVLRAAVGYQPIFNSDAIVRCGPIPIKYTSPPEANFLPGCQNQGTVFFYLEFWSGWRVSFFVFARNHFNIFVRHKSLCNVKQPISNFILPFVLSGCLWRRKSQQIARLHF